MLRRLPALGRFAALLALSLAAIVSCASPTLPLPPPEAPEIQAGADADHVKLVGGCGSVDPDAIVVILNTNPAVPKDQAVSGSLADGCGKWDAEVWAHRGDVLNVTQEFTSQESPPAVVTVM